MNMHKHKSVTFPYFCHKWSAPTLFFKKRGDKLFTKYYSLSLANQTNEYMLPQSSIQKEMELKKSR